jgi:hypothetical protein
VTGSHAHGAATEAAERLVAPPRLRQVLGALVLGVTLLALAGVLLLWPHQDPDRLARERLADPYAGVRFVSGEVLGTRQSQCRGTTEDRLPDATIPATTGRVTAKVRLDGGSTVDVGVPSQVRRAGLPDGDRVRLALYPPHDGSAPA